MLLKGEFWLQYLLLKNAIYSGGNKKSQKTKSTVHTCLLSKTGANKGMEVLNGVIK